MTLRALLMLCIATLATSAVASSPAEAVAAALADCKTLPAEDALTTRYLWYGGAEKGQKDFHAVLRLHWNLLSRDSEMAEVVAVKPWLFRLNLKDIVADAGTWERAEKVDHFFHVEEVAREDLTLRKYWPGGTATDGHSYHKAVYTETVKKGSKVILHDGGLDAKAVSDLRAMTYSECPVLEARWFLAQSARQVDWNAKQNGLGYYDWLGLKKRDDYFALIGLDEKASIKLHREIRAIIELSGVSPLPRQVVRLQSLTGGAWVTLDTNTAAGGNVATRQIKRGEFRHQAEEWYGFLPNNLPATYASSDAGVQQNFAPADTHGFSDSSPLNEGRDGRIHVNLACMRCHTGEVLKPLDDWVRKTFKAGSGAVLGGKTREERNELKRQYFSNLDRWLAKDRAEYVEAFQLATITPAHPRGMTAVIAVKAYARAFHGYVDDPVRLDDAARELGMKPADFSAALKRLASAPPIGIGRLDPPLSAYLTVPSGTLARSSWEQVYSLARRIARGEIPKEGEDE